ACLTHYPAGLPAFRGGLRPVSQPTRCDETMIRTARRRAGARFRRARAAGTDDFAPLPLTVPAAPGELRQHPVALVVAGCFAGGRVGIMSTIKGPAIFLAQFAGDTAPFDTLDNICRWAAGLGYKGVQIPTWIASFIDLEQAATSQAYADELKGRVAEHGLEIT